MIFQNATDESSRLGKKTSKYDTNRFRKTQVLIFETLGIRLFCLRNYWLRYCKSYRQPRSKRGTVDIFKEYL